MKKLLVALTMSISALMLTNVANAAPHFDDERHMDKRQGQAKKFRDRADNNQEDRRRMREERGVKRLQQMKWQPGYVMPQHYRGKGYKVEYRDHKLPKPDRKQQWYKVNNEYILVDSDNNSIIRILGH
ncbi:RcnB family protein [Acinetobacter sp. ASP199]|uniref:RcnB family protein n=1 Tax=unclassified Acinetobacter TaxID=196816 RepID=UPI001F616B74|nr:RcnB family protein [Acinetobacter sp. ASP199]UNT59300.1 RcnB family protein [Acinetobacter sp. ASP199]